MSIILPVRENYYAEINLQWTLYNSNCHGTQEKSRLELRVQDIESFFSKTNIQGTGKFFAIEKFGLRTIRLACRRTAFRPQLMDNSTIVVFLLIKEPESGSWLNIKHFRRFFFNSFAVPYENICSLFFSNYAINNRSKTF